MLENKNCLQSVHSNLCEKNSLLYTLLQHGQYTLYFVINKVVTAITMTYYD